VELQITPNRRAGDPRSDLDIGDPFPGQANSIRMLRTVAGQQTDLRRMRTLLAREWNYLDVSRLTDEGVRRQVSSLLGAGHLRLGEVEQSSRYGSAGVLPPPSAAETEEPPLVPVVDDLTTWVIIKLLDMEGEPIPEERYRALLEDGSSREGKLDQNGIARLSSLEPGVVKVCFPDLDESAWEAA
jgi:hypothetical protein